MKDTNLKSQVVSLELSKRLKELGVPQNSLFYWLTYESEDGKWGLEPMLKYGKDISGRIDNTSAFLVGELGEMFKKAGSELTIKAYGDLHGFKGTGAVGSIGVLWLLTEPDRLAKMLIYLLENNLIKSSDL